MSGGLRDCANQIEVFEYKFLPPLIIEKPHIGVTTLFLSIVIRVSQQTKVHYGYGPNLKKIAAYRFTSLQRRPSMGLYTACTEMIKCYEGMTKWD